MIEGKAKRGDLYRGKTRGFRSCLFQASERLVGELVSVRISRATASTLYGDLVISGMEDVDTASELAPNFL